MFHNSLSLQRRCYRNFLSCPVTLPNSKLLNYVFTFKYMHIQLKRLLPGKTVIRMKILFQLVSEVNNLLLKW